MKKIIAALLAAGICVMLCACSADVLNSVDAGNNSAGDEVEDEMQETEQGEDADASEPSDSSDEDSSDESESYTDYQSVLDAYTLKLQEAVPILVEEYKEEAELNTEGLTGLAELSYAKIEKLAEISNEGVEKMAEIMLYSGSGSMDEYMEWAGKLQNVYLE